MRNKFFFLLFTTCLMIADMNVGWTLATDFRKSVITDPSISRRCGTLGKRRREKLTVKQKLMALIVRNERLQKMTPARKKSIRKRLEINMSKLKHELGLAKLTIEQLEESIIRKGCPGIRL